MFTISYTNYCNSQSLNKIITLKVDFIKDITYIYLLI